MTDGITVVKAQLTRLCGPVYLDRAGVDPAFSLSSLSGQCVDGFSGWTEAQTLARQGSL